MSFDMRPTLLPVVLAVESDTVVVQDRDCFVIEVEDEGVTEWIVGASVRTQVLDTLEAPEASVHLVTSSIPPHDGSVKGLVGPRTTVFVCVLEAVRMAARHGFLTCP